MEVSAGSFQVGSASGDGPSLAKDSPLVDDDDVNCTSCVYLQDITETGR